MSTIAASGVSVNFGKARVLREVSIRAETGSWLCVIGPNGSGKTTLLRALAGLVSYEGMISIDETPLSGLSARERAKRIAMVPQNPLIPTGMSVLDYVLLGRTPYIGYLGVESRHDLEVAAHVMETLQLLEFSSRSVDTLSGGELQRVILARSLAQESQVLLLDEPTSALDIGHQQQVMELVDSLRIGRDLTIVGAMHDLTLAGQFAESLVLLDGGMVVASGPTGQVLTEEMVSLHYGARVEVIRGQSGDIVVAPQRKGRASKRS